MKVAPSPRVLAAGLSSQIGAWGVYSIYPIKRVRMHLIQE